MYLEAKEGEYGFYFQSTLYDHGIVEHVFDGSETVKFYISQEGMPAQLAGEGSIMDPANGVVRVLISSPLKQGRYKAQFVVEGDGTRIISRPIELRVGGGISD